MLEVYLRGPFVSRLVILLVLRIAVDVKANVLYFISHAYLARKGDCQKMFEVRKGDFLFELQKGIVVFKTSRIRACLEVFEISP